MSDMVFILVEPRTPENVGAAARALNTMGFTQLRLVNPCDYLSGAAQWLAHGSQELLAQAQVYSDLQSAVADCDLKIGTTAKLRHQRFSVLTPEQVRDTVNAKRETVRRVALIFGREDTGLSNTEIDLCDLLSTVPLAQPQPSINLAQAVMIYSYCLSTNQAAARFAPGVQEGEWMALRQKVVALIEQQQWHDEKMQQWLAERLPLLHDRDIRMLHRLLSKLTL